LLDADTDRGALRAAHARIAATTHNPNPVVVTVADATSAEQAVWAAIGDAGLRAWVEARYAA
jgi:hypothetical protein